MITETVSISGKNIHNKHTHYEALTYVGPEQVTVILRGDIFADFQKKYGSPMTAYEKLNVTAHFLKNSGRVAKDPSRLPSRLFGTVESIDDIVISK